MHSVKPHKCSLHRFLTMLFCMVVVAGLTGCGDGSSSTAYSPGAVTSGSGLVVAGVGVGGTGVIKSSQMAPVALTGSTGFIGAVVFVDTNNNRLPDSGEYSVVTDKDGSYSMPEGAAALAAYPLLMQVHEGVTIDRATGQVAASTYIVELRP